MRLTLVTIGSPLSCLYSPFVLTVTVVSVVICYVATLPKVRSVPLGEALMLFGAPILSVTVFIFAQDHIPGDFLAFNIALGASYLLAREASRLPTRSIRIAGWIEAIGFAMIAGYELVIFGL